MLTRSSIAFLSGMTLGIAPVFLFAQGTSEVPTPGVTQELLVSAELSQFPGKQVTVFTGSFEPGAATPRHKHPGTEILYVLEGRGEMQIAGRESIDLSPGKAVLVQPEAGEDYFIHQARNGSDTSGMKALVVVLHDADGPPALPVGDADH